MKKFIPIHVIKVAIALLQSLTKDKNLNKISSDKLFSGYNMVVQVDINLQGIPLGYMGCRPHFPHLSPPFFLLLSENEQDIELQ